MNHIHFGPDDSWSGGIHSVFAWQDVASAGLMLTASSLAIPHSTAVERPYTIFCSPNDELGSHSSIIGDYAGRLTFDLGTLPPLVLVASRAKTVQMTYKLF